MQLTLLLTLLTVLVIVAVCCTNPSVIQALKSLRHLQRKPPTMCGTDSGVHATSAPPAAQRLSHQLRSLPPHYAERPETTQNLLLQAVCYELCQPSAPASRCAARRRTAAASVCAPPASACASGFPLGTDRRCGR